MDEIYEIFVFVVVCFFIILYISYVITFEDEEIKQKFEELLNEFQVTHAPQT